MRHSRLKMAARVIIDEMRVSQLEQVAKALLEEDSFERVYGLLANGELDEAARFLFGVVHTSLEQREITVWQARDYFERIGMPPDRAEVVHQEHQGIEDEQRALILWEVKEKEEKEGRSYDPIIVH